MDQKIEYTRAKDSKGEGVRGFLSKLSKGLMLPIAVLPIAGLFLGIGSGIINIMDTVGLDKNTNPWYLIPIILRDIGNIIFATLPALFAVAIAIAYTDDAGIAAFTGFLGYVVFAVTQSILIFDNVDSNGILTSYQILWYDEVPTSVVGQTLGIKSLQTSVFGGITVGFVAAWLYNRFSTLRLPNFLGFFNGTRSVPIIAFMFMPLVAFIFLATWPLIGTWLDSFGQLLLGMNYGFDALLFGIIERALVPFGLHHAFYTPLWFTSVGGQIIAIDPGSGEQLVVAAGDESMWFAIQNYGLDYNSLTTEFWVTPNDTIENIININGYWVFDPSGNGGASTDINEYLLPAQNLDFSSGADQCVYCITAGAHPGQYLQGKYQFMIFGLPAAGFAMIMCAKKENREMATSLIGAAVLTTFLTGITEPIEFTFLFLAPMLYIFHVFMAGISFWVDDLLKVSVGMTFSGGIIDYILYGILPLATGYNTAAWIVIPIGIIYMPIYYFFFRWYILKFDVQTPGRGDSEEEMKLVSKKDYLEAKESKKEQKNVVPAAKKGQFDESNPRFLRTVSLLGYLGDFDNLPSINACITRLRISVSDPTKVDEENIKKKLGAKGIVKFSGGRSMQIIFGAEADIFKTELMMLKKQGFTYKEWEKTHKN
ncbi:MAG: PTS sugar transporter [Candidatus Hepatoplasma scabrum]|nr:MAG: PTS sugar transporter [Candidatus Hepatoplasma sp.]